MMDGLDFEDWLSQTQQRRDELDAYARSPLPKDISERHADIDMSIQNSDDCGRLLADAEGYLAHAKAQAMYAVTEKDPDISSKKMEIIIKDEIRNIQRIADGISVTSSTIRARIFAGMNANRSGL